MSTIHVDMMFSHLADWMEEDETLDSLVKIETLRFWREINQAKSQKYFQSPSKPFLCQLESHVKLKEMDFLVFPVQMDSVGHWLIFKLDFVQNEI
jgi:hypothetical protein